MSILRRRVFNLVAAMSMGLCAVTAASWVAGAVREPDVSAWRVWKSSAHSWFVRLDRQHLIISEQLMVPVTLPEGYEMDTTAFRRFTVTGPALPAGGVGGHLMPGSPILRPEHGGFRRFRLPVGGVQMSAANRATLLRVDDFYGAIEAPWWSLLLLFSVCPAAWLIARRRAILRHQHGHCPACGYDLRESPERCPECGAIAGQLRGGRLGGR